DTAGHLERLGAEHGPALLQLLDALVTLHGDEAHRVGHDQERAEDLLLGAPQLANLGPHGPGAALALRDQAVDEEERDEQQYDEKTDEEEFEARTAQDAELRLHQIRHGRKAPRASVRRRGPAR